MVFVYRVIHRAVLASFKRAIFEIANDGPREAGQDGYFGNATIKRDYAPAQN